MKIEREITIISGFLGFTIGVCGMLFVNVDQKQRMFERDIQLDSDTKYRISENINTCEDIVEWMNEDIFNGADSTMYYIYIPQLKNMAEYNRELLYETSEEGLNLQTEYDY